MSDMEAISGKLKEMDLKGETVYNYFVNMLEKDGHEIYNYILDGDGSDDKLNSCLWDYYGDRYIIINKKLYEFLEIDYLDINDIFTINKNSDGLFNFVTTFDTGGNNLFEQLESYHKDFE